MGVDGKEWATNIAAAVEIGMHLEEAHPFSNVEVQGNEVFFLYKGHRKSMIVKEEDE